MTKIAALVISDTEGPDILVRVHGEPLLAHTLRGLFEAGCVDRVVVAASARGLEACSEIVGKIPGARQRCRVLPCGADRAESIRLALDALDSFDAGGAPHDAILVHDAARPFVPPVTVRAVVDAVLRGAEAAAPVLPVTDTVKLVDGEGVVVTTEDRSRLRTVQTPFGFTESVLRDAGERGLDPLADPPATVRTVAGHPHAIRLATPFDLAVAEALLLEERA
ncbi:hypothetical protein FNH05_09245 [Amycolatopsis rhizosphaerae]|uniref:2-C-methyl-D-erythritol 4-phosphate cytidylyltransferase n=1 Tax=Amycolatopsis rhizosphaerae TaxID=2053003 RepID=A0A558D406_9PSEU|nr:2-C-methyl-D-erythritol 4-phosphate cytidylyltransferase [Amycolatopsis rhizosphaerae]TVT55739.1 hypothetical protein FNH05_09245 [Amycolatopsis rhizosphaerae]